MIKHHKPETKRKLVSRKQHRKNIYIYDVTSVVTFHQFYSSLDCSSLF